MASQRPVITFYNGGRVAHSVTPKAAIRAATRRILDGDYRSATILYGKDLLATVELNKHQINIIVADRRVMR